MCLKSKHFLDCQGAPIYFVGSERTCAGQGPLFPCESHESSLSIACVLTRLCHSLPSASDHRLMSTGTHAGFNDRSAMKAELSVFSIVPLLVLVLLEVVMMPSDRPYMRLIPVCSDTVDSAHCILQKLFVPDFPPLPGDVFC